MTNINYFKQSALGLSFLLSIPSVNAAGFALIENNASGMGNAYAGAAAVAEDASTIFFNPAGMTYIDGMQAVGALHIISPKAEFKDEGSIGGAGIPPRGDSGPDASDIAFIPNAYWMTSLTPDIKFGIGVNAPFGLKTEYDDNWVGRFQAVKSELKTININPSLAFKVNDQLSLGIGLSAMYAEAELTRQINRVINPESSIKVKGDDWGFGFNLGAIYQITQATRVGVSYRSKVKQRLKGDAEFGTALAALNTDVKAGVDLPESFSVSVFSHLDDKWDLLADVSWTRWSRFEELRIRFDNGAPDAVTEENWENSLRYSIGTSYHYNHQWTLRAGIAYDEEPIKTEFRTARIPGNDRKWLSLGASYKMNEQSKFDVGYSHLFLSDPKIDDDQLAEFNGRVTGKYKGSVDIISFQYTHTF